MFEVSNLDKPRAAKQASDSEPQLKAAIRVVEAARNYVRLAGRSSPSSYQMAPCRRWKKSKRK